MFLFSLRSTEMQSLAVNRVQVKAFTMAYIYMLNVSWGVFFHDFSTLNWAMCVPHCNVARTTVPRSLIWNCYKDFFCFQMMNFIPLYHYLHRLYLTILFDLEELIELCIAMIATILHVDSLDSTPSLLPAHVFEYFIAKMNCWHCTVGPQ